MHAHVDSCHTISKGKQLQALLNECPLRILPSRPIPKNLYLENVPKSESFSKLLKTQTSGYPLFADVSESSPSARVARDFAAPMEHAVTALLGHILLSGVAPAAAHQVTPVHADRRRVARAADGAREAHA